MFSWEDLLQIFGVGYTESCDQTLAQEKKINLVHQIIFLVMKSAWKQDYKVL